MDGQVSKKGSVNNFNWWVPAEKFLLSNFEMACIVANEHISYYNEVKCAYLPEYGMFQSSKVRISQQYFACCNYVVIDRFSRSFKGPIN